MFGKTQKHNVNPLFSATEKLQPHLLVLLVVFCLFCLLEARETQFVKVFFPDGSSVTAELAETPEQRQLGLMFRIGINPDQGMLLVFEEENFFAIWMKNMNFSLDILWLDQEKRIVHIECDVPPCQDDPCPSYSPQIPAMYVLELKAGNVRDHGLKLYDRLEFILSDRTRP